MTLGEIEKQPSAAIRLLELVAQAKEADLLIPLVIDEMLIRLLRSLAKGFFKVTAHPSLPAGVAEIPLSWRVAGGCHPHLPSMLLDSRQSIARMTGA